MAADADGTLVRCERAIGSVTAADADGTVHTRRTSFSGGRQESADARDFRVFSGDPPAPWHVELPPPAPLEEPDAVRTALAGLRAHFGGAAELCYTSVSAVRAVTGTANGQGPVLQERRVWSLTGDVFLGGGRTVPVGRSGRGPGLDRVADPAWRESTHWLLGAVRQAAPLDAGDYPAVLSPQVTGVLLHEAAGHFAEAAAQGRPGLGHRLGCRVAAEVITLDDDPGAEGGPARYDSDDDGILSLGPQRFVHEGRLVRQLHGVASAAAARSMPTANSRAASVLQRPLPRMSNVLCRSGDALLDELVEHTGQGLLVHRVADGIRFGGAVEARLVLGEHIRRGRHTGRYVTGRIRESADVLTRITELGRHTEFGDNSLCGKDGQMLFDVGLCAPAARLSRLRCVS
jgi:TldD protein